MMIGCDEGENIFAFGLIFFYLFLLCMAFIAAEGNDVEKWWREYFSCALKLYLCWWL